MLNQKDTEFSGGFAVGPLAGWRSDFMFPSTGLTQDQSAIQVAHDVRTRVMPALGLISSTEALLQFLCKDEEPNPWYRSQCLTRFAEIACLAKMLGKPDSSYMHLAGKHRVFLEEQLTDIALEQYISNVQSALQSAG